MSALLELLHITKRFPGVVALEDVSLAVGAGEVVALIGENGAGKSTLMKTLGGVHQADSGEIRINGRRVTIRSVGDATRLGIGFVHQELNNLDNLDVAANLFLGRELRFGGPLQLLDRRRMVEQSRVHLQRLGLHIDPRQPLRELSLAQQQMVEIAKALSLDARLIILDEPTSSLTAAETDRLLATVLELRAQGVSIIYISHRLNEIGRIADRVVALRDGRNAGELDRSQIAHDNMVRLMIGRDLKSMFVEPTSQRREKRLELRSVRTSYAPSHAIDLEVAGGEILGLAGLVGAGRSQLAETIFGVTPPLAGRILLDGEPLVIHGPRDAIRAGIFLVPEDRRRTGLITDFTLRQNITLPGLWHHTMMGLINSSSEQATAESQIEALRVKTPSAQVKAATLSGGNQQKVVLAKWLALRPTVLIVDEPTRGIDVGSKAEIYRLLRDLADNGVAIIAISSDMEEVLGISDRIAVMREGALAGILDRSDASEEAVMQLAFGREMAASISAARLAPAIGDRQP